MAKKTEPAKGIRVEQAITIDRPAEDLYRYWRDLENLPKLMDHLQSVTAKGERISHWIAGGAGRMKLEWDAEIVSEEEGRLIAWQSLKGSDLGTAGSVHFQEALGNRGTEVKLVLMYTPIGKTLGSKVSKLLGEEPAQEIRGSLRKFKQLMETGGIATIEGQPSGGKR